MIPISTLYVEMTTLIMNDSETYVERQFGDYTLFSNVVRGIGSNDDIREIQKRLEYISKQRKNQQGYKPIDFSSDEDDTDSINPKEISEMLQKYSQKKKNK